MKYHSTRNTGEKYTASEAIARGLAPDGGLFVPDELPTVSARELDELLKLDYRGRAVKIMSKFLAGYTQEELEAFTARAYGENFDCSEIAPLHFTDDGTAFLELWHGPTCAFKDMALQMLPQLLTASLKKTGEKRTVCILVATSGDTGKAALEGFKDVEGTKIFVFYPKNGVSDIQRLQMVTQEGKNVGVCGVTGNFDDAQTGVKQVFSDEAAAARLNKAGYFLSSANSINWGRLLPQIVYYFSAYCDYVNAGKLKMGEELVFCVPTGNFGNILAGWYAARMGLPVAKFVCASNENNVLTDFIHTGTYDKNRRFHQTISPSMDILVSSNLERLLYSMSGDETVRWYMQKLGSKGKYTVSQSVFDAVRRDFAAGCCTDVETKRAIRAVFEEKNYLMDTHTAVAYKVLCDYRAETGDARPAVVVSTASPFKFAADVLDALGETASVRPMEQLAEKSGLPVPAPLADLDKRNVRFDDSATRLEMRGKVVKFLSE